MERQKPREISYKNRILAKSVGAVLLVSSGVSLGASADNLKNNKIPTAAAMGTLGLVIGLGGRRTIQSAFNREPSIISVENLEEVTPQLQKKLNLQDSELQASQTVYPQEQE